MESMSFAEVVLNAGQNYRITGGSDRYMLALGGLLESRGHQVVPFAAAHPDNLPTPWQPYFPPQVDFVRPSARDLLRYVYSASAADAMRRLLGSVKVDVAHLHIYYGQLTAAILRPLREAGVPVVQTLHEYKLVCPTYALQAHGRPCQACEGRHFWRAVQQRCNRGSLARSALSAVEAYVSRALGALDGVQHFIAVSDFLRNKVIELGVPAHKVTRLHNFVSCAGVQPACEPGGYFLYLGRLERNKGIFTLLDAVAPLTEMPLVIAGDGSERAALAVAVEQRGLAHVRVVGFQRGQELEALVRGSICTVAPSEWYETFGLTLTESFVHGRPVVASAIGGMPEVVSDGTDGWLFPPGDVEALRERLRWMWAHRAEAVAMGHAGREKVETRFSPERHYEGLMSIYQRAGVH